MASLDVRRLRRLLPYFGQDRRRLLLALLLLIPLALAGALQPLLVGQAIAALRAEPVLPWLRGLPVPQVLRTLVGLLLGVVLLRLALQGTQSFNVQVVGQRLTARIREALFHHVLALSLRFHDTTPTGKLVTRLTSDVEALAEVFGTGAVGLLGDLVSLVVVSVVMLTIEWRLGLMLIALQIPVTLGMLWLQRRYRRANYRVREELGQLNADLQENLQGLEVVQMFQREEENSRRFRRTSQTYRRAVDGVIFYDSAISAMIEWVSQAAIALVLAVGGAMVTGGAMGLGLLTSFILFSLRLFDPLRQLAERFTQIQGGLTAVERIDELLSRPIDIQDRPEALRTANPRPAALRTANPQVAALRPAVLATTAPATSTPTATSGAEVVFDGVSFAYRPDDPILHNLSFRIAAGEHVAIVGPTGSGKTTIIRLLCRLYEPQAGRILLDGVDIRDLP
ncbi:MAG: ABC transporter ATP-binding protein, partial [Cyanobacteria bacterium K_Offshore_surface_m2_239]|nr:ABC transporter ATP-binding protein [Cyanobacteria bacterium K_Offshore_surface_m2_239]